MTITFPSYSINYFSRLLDHILPFIDLDLKVPTLLLPCDVQKQINYQKILPLNFSYGKMKTPWDC